jgi:hypothetical protein
MEVPAVQASFLAPQIYTGFCNSSKIGKKNYDLLLK